MKFTEIMCGVAASTLEGEAEVCGLQYDSRRVKKGDCFFAIKGETTDGSRYIREALQAGAVAVITDTPQNKPYEVSAWAVVEKGRRAMSEVAANFLRHPEAKLKLTGVTGTNGKTTTTYLIEAMLNEAGRGTALIGTIEYRLPGAVKESPHTTPESLDLFAFLAEAVEHNASEAVMEVSSHALAQERVYGVPFDVAVFTNLTQDHLDFHKSMDEYYVAKKILFSGCGTAAPRMSVVNLNDTYGQKLAVEIKQAGKGLLTYGTERGDVHARHVDIAPDGLRFELVTPQGEMRIQSDLIGRVNVENILAASAAALARGCTVDHIRRAINKLIHVPGRFQRVNLGQPFTVVVDYAHTDDALRNLIQVAREFIDRAADAAGILHSGHRGRVLTLFGCGGDRDKTKRPRMGKVAGAGSDFVILTSDNPRTEDPLSIIHDALQGLQMEKAEYRIEPDRKRAIQMAVEMARPGDIVLIAGKGHEKSQIIGKRVEAFDDIEIAKRALYNCGYTDDFSRALDFGTSAGVLA